MSGAGERPREHMDSPPPSTGWNGKNNRRTHFPPMGKMPTCRSKLARLGATRRKKQLFSHGDSRRHTTRFVRFALCVVVARSAYPRTLSNLPGPGHPTKTKAKARRRHGKLIFTQISYLRLILHRFQLQFGQQWFPKHHSMTPRSSPSCQSTQRRSSVQHTKVSTPLVSTPQ